MTPTNTKTISSQADTLVKLYLEGKPAKIPDEAIAQLCDWHWEMKLIRMKYPPDDHQLC